MSGNAFDLNVDRVLEHWATSHAVREIIANALEYGRQREERRD